MLVAITFNILISIRNILADRTVTVLSHFAQSHFAQSYFAQSHLLTLTPNPNPTPNPNTNPNPLGELGLGEMGLGEMGGHPRKSSPKNFGGSTVILKTLLRLTLPIRYTWLCKLFQLCHSLHYTQSLSEYRPG